MDHGMSGKRIHMYSNKRDIEQNTHQEAGSMDEEHTRGAIIGFFTGNRIYSLVCSYILLWIQCIQVKISSFMNSRFGVSLYISLCSQVIPFFFWIHVSHVSYTLNFLFLITFSIYVECHWIHVSVYTSTRIYEDITCRSSEYIHTWIELSKMLMEQIKSYKQYYVRNAINIDVIFEDEKIFQWISNRTLNTQRTKHR